MCLFLWYAVFTELSLCNPRIPPRALSDTKVWRSLWFIDDHLRTCHSGYGFFSRSCRPGSRHCSWWGTFGIVMHFEASRHPLVDRYGIIDAPHRFTLAAPYFPILAGWVMANGVANCTVCFFHCGQMGLRFLNRIEFKCADIVNSEGENRRSFQNPILLKNPIIRYKAYDRWQVLACLFYLWHVMRADRPI